MKVWKIALTCVLMIGLSLGSVACSSESSSNDNDDDTLIVGFDQNFPPFGYVDDNGDYVGFDLDLAKEAAKRLGMKVKYQPIDWDSKDMELESGTIDCIWNGFTISGRENKYTWTDPYMDNSQVVIVRSDSGISSLKDLSGKNVEVQKESSAETAINDDEDLKNSFAQFTSVADYNTGIMDLESGAADAIAMDIYVAKDQIAGKDDLTILDEYISTEQYGVGFLKGNTELRDKVEGALKEMVKDGTFKEISEKWFDGQDVCILSADDTSSDSNVQSATDKNRSISLVDSFSQLIGGMGTTIQIFVLTLVFSLPLGLLIAFGRMAKNGILRNFIKVCISLLRGTPLMLQLLVVYFGPYYLLGMSISSAYRGIAVIIAFSLNYAAYFAEIYRSGIESMPKGQYEAAKVLGYSKVQTFFTIIFPQVLKRILPSLTNEIITLVKDTSLAFSIAYMEMFTQAKALAASFKSMIPFIAAAIFYYVFNFLVASLMEYFEKKMNYYN